MKEKFVSLYSIRNSIYIFISWNIKEIHIQDFTILLKKLRLLKENIGANIFITRIK